MPRLDLEQAELVELSVVCPAEVTAGETLVVENLSGKKFDAVVPDGVQPGQTFKVFVAPARGGFDEDDCDEETTSTWVRSAYEEMGRKGAPGSADVLPDMLPVTRLRSPNLDPGSVATAPEGTVSLGPSPTAEGSPDSSERQKALTEDQCGATEIDEQAGKASGDAEDGVEPCTGEQQKAAEGGGRRPSREHMAVMGAMAGELEFLQRELGSSAVEAVAARTQQLRAMQPGPDPKDNKPSLQIKLEKAPQTPRSRQPGDAPSPRSPLSRSTAAEEWTAEAVTERVSQLVQLRLSERRKLRTAGQSPEKAARRAGRVNRRQSPTHREQEIARLAVPKRSRAPAERSPVGAPAHRWPPINVPWDYDSSSERAAADRGGGMVSSPPRRVAEEPAGVIFDKLSDPSVFPVSVACKHSVMRGTGPSPTRLASRRNPTPEPESRQPRLSKKAAKATADRLTDPNTFTGTQRFRLERTAVQRPTGDGTSATVRELSQVLRRDDVNVSSPRYSSPARSKKEPKMVKKRREQVTPGVCRVRGIGVESGSATVHRNCKGGDLALLNKQRHTAAQQREVVNRLFAAAADKDARIRAHRGMQLLQAHRKRMVESCLEQWRRYTSSARRLKQNRMSAQNGTPRLTSESSGDVLQRNEEWYAEKLSKQKAAVLKAEKTARDLATTATRQQQVRKKSGGGGRQDDGRTGDEDTRPLAERSESWMFEKRKKLEVARKQQEKMHRLKVTSSFSKPPSRKGGAGGGAGVAKEGDIAQTEGNLIERNKAWIEEKHKRLERAAQMAEQEAREMAQQTAKAVVRRVEGEESFEERNTIWIEEKDKRTAARLAEREAEKKKLFSPATNRWSVQTPAAELRVGKKTYEATVADFGKQVAWLRDISLVLADPPLADGPLANMEAIRGSVAVIVLGGTPRVEQARRAQVANAVGVIFIDGTDRTTRSKITAQEALETRKTVHVTDSHEGAPSDLDLRELPIVTIQTSDGATISAQLPCTCSLFFGAGFEVRNAAWADEKARTLRRRQSAAKKAAKKAASQLHPKRKRKTPAQLADGDLGFEQRIKEWEEERRQRLALNTERAREKEMALCKPSGGRSPPHLAKNSVRASAQRLSLLRTTSSRGDGDSHDATSVTGWSTRSLSPAIDASPTGGGNSVGCEQSDSIAIRRLLELQPAVGACPESLHEPEPEPEAESAPQAQQSDQGGGEEQGGDRGEREEGEEGWRGGAAAGHSDGSSSDDSDDSDTSEDEEGSEDGDTGGYNLRVICPTGLLPGQGLALTAPDGREVTVGVPPGVRPGDEFEVHVEDIGEVDSEDDIIALAGLGAEGEMPAPLFLQYQSGVLSHDGVADAATAAEAAAEALAANPFHSELAAMLS